MFRILIVGDRYFLPEFFEDELKKELCTKYDLEILTLQLPYPQDYFSLYETTVIPSGMSVEDPNIPKTFCDGIQEYYGESTILKDYVQNTDMLLVHGAPLPREVIDTAKQLKCVVALRGGPVNVDAEYLQQKGIPLYHTSGKNASAVAEMVIGLVLAFLRQIPYGTACLQKNIWPLRHAAYESTGTELFGKTFGLIGFGAIGQHLSKILHGFGVVVLAYDPYVPDECFDALQVIRCQDINRILSECDFVSLHARLPKGSPPIISTQQLMLMKPSAILINTARGAQLDYPALKEALEQHRIRGAILDVLGQEPFGFYKQLLQLPNVLVTPHMAGCSQETVKRAVSTTLKQINDILEELLCS